MPVINLPQNLNCLLNLKYYSLCYKKRLYSIDSLLTQSVLNDKIVNNLLKSAVSLNIAVIVSRSWIVIIHKFEFVQCYYTLFVNISDATLFIFT